MKPFKEKALQLMTLALPPFEAFLEHGDILRTECDKAGELTPENAKAFDDYRNMLISKRDEYEDEIAELICEESTAEDVDLLIEFYKGSSTFKAVEKMLALGTKVDGIGTAWRTRQLENCPDTWKMLIDRAGLWVQKNTPAGTQVIVPPNKAAEQAMLRDGDPLMPAQEFDPATITEPSVPFTP